MYTSCFLQTSQAKKNSSVLLFKQFFTRSSVITLMVLSFLGGICLGLILRLRSEPYTARELMYLRLPGEILLNMLSLITLPLVVSSIISGLSVVDVKVVTRLGVRIWLYCFGSNVLACVMGVSLAVMLLPRVQPVGQDTHREVQRYGVIDVIFDVIRQMLPSNMVESTFEKAYTMMKEKKGAKSFPLPLLEGNSTNSTARKTMVPVLLYSRGINILGVVMMSCAAGIIINIMGVRALPLKVYIDSVYEVTLAFVDIIERYMPIGILFLVTENVARLKDTVMRQMTYFITTLAALLIHGLVTLPGMYFIICHRNPYIFFRKQLQTILTALITSSSLATLPITMKNLKESRVDTVLVDILAPIGTAMQRNGTIIYQTIAVIFLGRADGFMIGISQLLIIGLMSMLTSMLTTGTKQGSLVTSVFIMDAVGFNPKYVSTISSVEWLLEELCTFTNVLGVSYGCAVVEHLAKRDLIRLEQQMEDTTFSLQRFKRSQMKDIKVEEV